MWSNANMTMGGNQGGFMDNSIVENDQGKSNPKRGNNIVPLMIGHLTNCSADRLSFWEIPIRVVSIVGIVRKIEEQSTKIAYEIEDETGTISALKWLEADKKITDPNIPINSYVKVNGVIREQNGQTHVLVLKISLLESLDEFVNHFLEVTYALLKAESLLSSKDSGETTFNSGSVEQPAQSSETNLHYGMTQEQSIIYNIITAENHTECGIERSDIIRKVPKHIQPRVDKILDFLTCEGHIYTTSTDDHFKTT